MGSANFQTQKQNTMSKQTSVEWLIDKLTCDNGDGQRVLSFSKMTDITEYCENAKEMHRKEILEARQNGLDNGFSNGNWESNLYYEESFKKD